MAFKSPSVFHQVTDDCFIVRNLITAQWKNIKFLDYSPSAEQTAILFIYKIFKCLIYLYNKQREQRWTAIY